SAEPTGAAAARATGRERVTERHPGPRKQRRARRGEHGARSGKSAASGEEFTTKPGASEDQDKEEMQGHGASAAEWRSTGPEGGADGDEAEGAWCPVMPVETTAWYRSRTRWSPFAGRRPRRDQGLRIRELFPIRKYY